MRRVLPLLLLPGLLGCNPYALFLVAGYEQANFNNDADILFVIDNSDSMRPVSEGVALSFNQFIDRLASSEGADVPHESLSDAVTNYLTENSGNSLFIDYQLAITTTSVAIDRGPTAGLDPGEAGTLVGTPPVITRGAGDTAVAFRDSLLCNATCWVEGGDQGVPSDPTFVCTDAPDPGDQVTSEYLDCVCGAGNWLNHCGSGNEMGLEAAALALCRATDSPPDACFEYADPEIDPEAPPIYKPTQLTDADVGSNEGLLREGATTVVVIVTDEGDGSYRMATGDTDVGPYEDLFSELPNPVRLAVIGPGYHDGAMPCNSGDAQPWAVSRYQNAVDAQFGVYVDIEGLNDADPPACAYTDFGTNLEQIGELLSTLQSLFPLQVVPDVATIQVYVEGVIVEPASIVSGSVDTGDAVYGDGWSYEASENAVAFHGAALPDYNSDVKIYYLPLGSKPRDLPPAF